MKLSHSAPVLASTLALLLAACGQVPASPPSSLKAAGHAAGEYALTVSIASGATREALVRQYGGRVALFAPDAGFAVLEVSEASAQRFVQGVKPQSRGVKLEKNHKRFTLGFKTSGAGSLWAGGAGSLWAGGAGSLWAGGAGSLWAGGAGSLWAGGEYSVLPENTALWQKLQLDEVHAQWDSYGVNTAVKVAVIDTGIDLAHPAFEGALVPVAEMRDFIDGDTVPQDEGVMGEGAVGHGTNVAGIVLQIAPNAQILPLRVLDVNGEGSAVTVAEAIKYAADQGARIINLSMGSSDPSPAVMHAIRYATEQKGALVIAAAGNENKDGANYPAADSTAADGMGARLIGVSSVSLNDSKSSFANYGRGVELAGLGEAVTGPAPDNRKAAWSGTSQATPEVAGALALALGSGKLGVSADALPALLQANTDPVNTVEAMGAGRLNLKKFMDAAVIR